MGAAKRVETVRLNTSPEDLGRAANWLNAGEVGGIPTETVYGLAGLTQNDRALEKIFFAKGRPRSDPLIVHVPRTWNSLRHLTDKKLIDVSDSSREIQVAIDLLLGRFWPGPLTILLPRGEAISDLVTASTHWVAIRMPAHPASLELLNILQAPICAPSANQFGRISPTSAGDVAQELDGKIKFIVDGGACAVGVESTVAQFFSDGTFLIRRPGKISATEIIQIAGLVARSPLGMTEETEEKETNVSPGNLLSHYAPKKPLQFFIFLATPSVDEMQSAFESKSAHPKKNALVTWITNFKLDKMNAIHSSAILLTPHLPPDKMLEEIAQNLFAAFRQADAAPTDCIAVALVKPPSVASDGLWAAILDRLTRAATP